uniref:Uncharacterized protein n=1 Tax=Rhizophora mucronata TaxID=61149 RepID=A0A2P2QZK7_RHIMU
MPERGDFLQHVVRGYE